MTLRESEGSEKKLDGELIAARRLIRLRLVVNWWLIACHINHYGTTDLITYREEQNVLSNGVSIEVHLIGTGEEVVIVLC